jgi:hypothetical protein
MAPLFVCALLACSREQPAEVTPEGSGSAPAPSASSAFAGKPTSALVKRPNIAALVDALAAEKRVESSHVGAAGAPSDAYKKYRALVKQANADEVAALLQHESPVVRTYLAQHVASELPDHLRALVPLASDTTQVDTLEGCIGGRDTVGDRVRTALCESDLPQAGPALMAIHREGGTYAAEALACAAPTAPKPAREIASKGLRTGGISPRVEMAYLDVLAIAGNEEDCALARARKAHDDVSVQIAAARALWRCDDDASREALRELARRENHVIALNAEASLFLLTRAKLATPDVLRTAGQLLAPMLRGAEGTQATSALFETLLADYPNELAYYLLQRALVVASTTAAVRRVIAKLQPGGPQSSGRQALIDYLVRARDRDSLPEFRRSLDSQSTYEIIAALRGIEALRDKTARAAVDKLTHHENAEVAEAARHALTALDAP